MVWRANNIRPARGDREGRPRPVGSAGVPRGSRAAARADRDRPVDRLRREERRTRGSTGSSRRSRGSRRRSRRWSIRRSRPRAARDERDRPEAPRQLRDGDWAERAGTAGRRDGQDARAVRAGAGRARRGAARRDARGPRDGLRPHRRPRAARRARPRPVLRLAPAERRSAVPVRAGRPVPGRLGRAPGRRGHGRPRGERRAPDPQGRRSAGLDERRPAVPDPGEHALPRRRDEFDEFGTNDLPQYSDCRGSFYKVPWAVDEEAIRDAGADVAIVGAPYDEGVSSRPAPGSGRWRSARAHVTSGSPWSWSIQTEVEPFDVLTVVDAGDAPVVPGRPERSLRVIHEKVRRVARAGAIPIVLGGDHSVTYPSAAAVARVHDPASVGIVHFDAHADTACRPVGVADRPRAADAPADRGGVGRRAPTSSRSGSAATGRTARRSTGCGSRVPLAHAGRDGGARRRGRDRRGDRRGARRPRPRLPLGRHRRRRPGDGSRTGTPESGGMLGRELLRAVRRIVGPWTSPGWTSWRSPRRTTTPRSPRCSRRTS